jgi:hypothetical protein
MSCAARSRPPALDPLTCYRLDDGTVCVVACSPEVAAVLDAPEPPLKETTFTDLAAMERPPREVDVRTEAWLSSELRVYYRNLRTGRVTDSPWCGPRISFDHFIGESRIWHGPPNGHRCAWHGKRLEPGEYCLGCDRCGLDDRGIIPRPSKEAVLACRRAEEERRKEGRGLKGGKG